MKYLFVLLLIASCASSHKTKDREDSIVIDPIVVNPIVEEEKEKKEYKGGMKECQRKLENKDKALNKCSEDLDLCKDMYEAPEPKDRRFHW